MTQSKHVDNTKVSKCPRQSKHMDNTKVSKCPRQSKHMDSTISRSVNVLDSLNTWTVQYQGQ